MRDGARNTYYPMRVMRDDDVIDDDGDSAMVSS
jgi:hypothetical protein